MAGTEGGMEARVAPEGDGALLPSPPTDASAEAVQCPAERVGPSEALAGERSRIMEAVGEAKTQRELTDLTALFNANLAKTEMVRAGRQSDLLDKVIEHAAERIENNADALTDKDILGYMAALQAGLSKSKETFNRDMQANPIVLVNHSEVNVNASGDGLDRDSRERVMDAVRSILGQLAVPTPQEAIDAVDGEGADEEEEDDEGCPEGEDSGADEGRP